MGRQDLLVQERLKKLEALRKIGVNPYISKFDITHNCAEIQHKYLGLKPEEVTKDSVRVAGRLMNMRDLGKIAFGVLFDGYNKVQIVFQEGKTPEKARSFLKDFVDSGDIIGVEGIIFRTQRGEVSVLVNSISMLTKSLLPLPEKWHGIQDEEEKLRKRYLDILMNPQTREMFIRKGHFWNSMRMFLISRGFVEVETPVLETSAGGASATPFATHHNALDLDVYLRISMGELWQKKLMVAGYPKTFEIGRQFRNEGMDSEHLQDYSQMEFYWAYANYKDGMELVEELYRTLSKQVYGKTVFTTGEHTFDLAEKWGTIDYADTIKSETGIDIFSDKTSEMEKTLLQLKQEVERNADRVSLIDSLWKYCRKKITGPVFLTGQIVEVSPLAKRDSIDPRKTEHFQVIVGGSEVGHGYSELNDPLDQEQRFMEQQKLKDAGNTEAHSHDKDFVEALKYGMPPTCGFGVSERLFAFFEGKPIRETVIFPLMKPVVEQTAPTKEKSDKSESGGKVNKNNVLHEKLDISENELKLMPNRTESLKLLNEYVKSKSLQTHCLAVEASMRAYAKKYNENEEVWGIAGLLHDFDYEKYPAEHPIKGVEILRNKKYPDAVLRAILGHYSEKTGVKRSSLLDKGLFSVDELSGFIVALSKVRPNGFEGMTAESIEKALNKKDFAKGVSREDVSKGINELEVDRKEHFEFIISALKNSINFKKEDSKENILDKKKESKPKKKK